MGPPSWQHQDPLDETFVVCTVSVIAWQAKNHDVFDKMLAPSHEIIFILQYQRLLEIFSNEWYHNLCNFEFPGIACL